VTPPVPLLSKGKGGNPDMDKRENKKCATKKKKNKRTPLKKEIKPGGALRTKHKGI